MLQQQRQQFAPVVWYIMYVPVAGEREKCQSVVNTNIYMERWREEEEAKEGVCPCVPLDQNNNSVYRKFGALMLF